MIFIMDTEKCEDIKLRFDRNANLEETIAEFCFGMSALYMDFCMQLGLDQEQTRGLLDGVSDEELDGLEQAMSAAGFPEKEIDSIVALAQDAGSMDAALGILKGIGEEAGINWLDVEETE